MNNQNNFGTRQMYQGNWSCSDCGSKITELPFEPSGDKSLFCRDCHRKQKPSKNFNEKRMFRGDWSCSGCGTKITELPFEPKGDSSLFCRDCYRQKDRR